MRKIYLLSFLLLSYTLSFGWGTDVAIPQSSTADDNCVSMTKDASGKIYLATGSVGTPGLISVYTSSDNGQTWTATTNVAISSGRVKKLKIVTTSVDSVCCVFLANDTVFTLNARTLNITPTVAEASNDFDVATSLSGNTIYLYSENLNTSTIKRYSSTDGGLSWTGSTATVTSIGIRPRVSMDGTRLILNYLGPINSDTTTSTIRVAYYNEGSPGQITPATFSDLITTTSYRPQYMPVIKNGIVWIIYSEENTPANLSAVVSTDNGLTYGSPFTILTQSSGTPGKFIAIKSVGGIDIAYIDIADSKLYYTSAGSSNPNLFIVSERVDDIDASDRYPAAAVSLSGNDIGVCWYSQSASTLLFDAGTTTTYLSNDNAKESFTLYPNPATTKAIISLKNKLNQDQMVEITDLSGRTVQQFPVSSGADQIDLNLDGISKGIYIVKINGMSERISIQ